MQLLLGESKPLKEPQSFDKLNNNAHDGRANHHDDIQYTFPQERFVHKRNFLSIISQSLNLNLRNSKDICIQI